MSDTPEKLHTLRDVADRLNVSERTVRRWIHAGQVEVIDTGRKYLFEEKEIKRFLDMRRRARIRRQTPTSKKRAYTRRAPLQTLET